MNSHGAALLAAFLAASSPAIPPANAQTTLDRAAVRPGSEWYDYLGVIASAGLMPARPLGAALAPLAAQDTVGPWRLAAVTTRFSWLPLELVTSFNSRYPWGADDGPLWQGRGFSGSLRAGMVARWRAVTLVVSPVLALSENAAFPLFDNGRGGDTAFAPPQAANRIDRPQRPGNGTFAVLDPGASMLRVDAGAIAFGFATGNEIWGPALRYPLILGTNAAGMPRMFLETDHGVDVGVGSLRGRASWGRLGQSTVGTETGRRASRMGAGLMMTLQPAGMTGLEIGASRFFHTVWPDRFSLGDLARPFDGILRGVIPPDSTGEGDNQLASVFFRWILPEAGLEFFGEYGREDHAIDFNDLVQEPDHNDAWGVGVRRIWSRQGGRLVSLSLEAVDASRSRLVLGRTQVIWYTHANRKQGHTQRGQVLGSEAVFGGRGAAVSLDVYHERGRWGAFVSREQRAQQFVFLNTDPRTTDVQVVAGGDVLLLRGSWDVGASLAAVHNLNRYFQADVFNLQLGVRATWHPSRPRANSIPE